MLKALGGETDARVLQQLGAILHGMVSSSIQFSDYQLATRILHQVRARQRELEASGEVSSQQIKRLLERPPDPQIRQLLEDDLKSGESERQEQAAQVIGNLGRHGIPLLVDVIKQEKNYRVRQLAATLLSEMGEGASRRIKKALATEVIVEQRFHILEVIDTITKDLRDELEYSLGDGHSKIRRAALRLFERLHRDELIDLVIPLARDDDPAVAKGAIRSLAHLRSQQAIEALAAVLDETDQPDVAVACCQALGQLEQPAGIEPLTRVLGARKFLFFGRRWNDRVRGTAAMALKQIPHESARKALARYRKDSAARVRQFARSASRQEAD